MFKKILIVLIIGMFVQAENNATDFLATGLSARGLALGNSLVALGSGLDGAVQNPAAIAYLDCNSQFISSAVNNFDMVERRNVGFAFNVDDSNYGFLISNSLVGDIPRTSWGIDDRPRKNGVFSSEQYNYSLFYGHAENEFFSWGASIRNYAYRLAEYNANGLGLSAGMRYRLSENYFDSPIVFGLAFQNIGRTKITWSTGHYDTIPMRVNLGGSLYRELFDRKTVLISEIEQEEGLPFVWRNGAEYWLVNRILALRGGLEGKYLSCGLGLRYEDLTLDYAQTEKDELGFIRRVTVGLSF